MTDTPAVTDYVAFLRTVANETADPCLPPETTAAPHPTLFLMETLSAVLDAEPPPTRYGLDAVCDILFSHPAVAPLLADQIQSAVLQAHFADRYLSQSHHDHWTHIILPAWQQHTELQATLLQTTIN
jgi:hypothetical protein